MALPQFNTEDPALTQLQNTWASVLDPVIKKIKQLTMPQEPTIQRFFSGSGTYVPPDGVLFVWIKLVGGGGGGGGCINAAAVAAGAGGGGGGYVEHFINASQLSRYSYQVGNGGAGGGAGNNAGVAGGATTFGVLFAGGGAGGGAGASSVANPGIAAVSAAGGSATGGNILNVRGMPSMNSLAFPSNGQAVASVGGNSVLGFGAPIAGNDFGAGLPAASNTGGGGSGASCANSGGAAAGGAGGSGFILVYEFYQ